MCRYGPTIAICFVLLVAAVKAIVEDKKRHDEDNKTNNSQAHVVQDDGEALLIPLTPHNNIQTVLFVLNRFFASTMW